MNKSILGKPIFLFTQATRPLGIIACWIGIATLLLHPSEALAVKAGEMRDSVNYVTSLLDNNIVPLILAAGVAGGAAFGFMKQNFAPLVMASITAVGYGFCSKWISTVYSVCI
jgi:hypothetical protein